MADTATAPAADTSTQQTTAPAAGSETGGGDYSAFDKGQQSATDNGATAPADWRSGMPEGWADKLKDVKSADDAMAAMQRGLAYHPAEKADDIQLKYPDGVEFDKDVVSDFQQLCVDQKLTAGQAQALLDWQLKANAEISENMFQQGQEELKGRWGSRYNENSNKALTAVAALDKRMNGRLSAGIAARGLTNDPLITEMFALFGQLASEDSLSGGMAAAAPDTPETAEDTYKNMGFK